MKVVVGFVYGNSLYVMMTMSVYVCVCVAACFPVVLYVVNGSERSMLFIL